MQRLKSLFCYLWRHKITYNDSGCDVCGRCGKHEYYDNDFNDGKPVFKILNFFRWRFYKIKAYVEYEYFGKLPF